MHRVTLRTMYEKVLDHLQDVYQVSRSVVVIRLRELRLVEDRRSSGPKHTAQLFNEEGESSAPA